MQDIANHLQTEAHPPHTGSGKQSQQAGDDDVACCYRTCTHQQGHAYHPQTVASHHACMQAVKVPASLLA
eukprot:1158524-Pelagomonas_calceolata.AAC.6